MKKYNENRIFIWSLLFALLLQLIYLSIASTNVPIMDYWKYINMFVEKMNTGGISFADLWQNDGIHRSPLQFLYFVLNVRFFNMNAQVEIYLGAFLMALIVMMLYYTFKREIGCKSSYVTELGGICIILFVFNLNQYEIINEQFALSFASRIILFVLSYLLTNSLLHDLNRLKKYTFELSVFYVFVILSVGSGFFPAYVMAIGMTIFLHFILNFRIDKYLFIKQYLMLYFALLLGSIIYLYGAFGETSQISQNSLSLFMFVKNFIIGSLTMLGVCVLGFEFSVKVTFIVGCIIGILIIVSICLYFKREYYKKSYLPILFYGYSAGVMGLVYLGRSARFGLDYAYSPRYVGESNFVLYALIWIVFMYISEQLEAKDIRSKSLNVLVKTILISCVIFICLGILNSDYKEWKIAPYRKIYGQNLVQSIFEVDTLEEKDFVAFQAEEDVVRSGIDIMKKYDLGVFYYN